MHISEGILTWPVLAAGAGFALAGTGIGLRKLKTEDIPKTAIMSAAFFVASLIHVPLGPSSVHLVLNGIVGLLLGWAAFPAILVALSLQSLFFQYGGITTLGVNTTLMAAPAVLCYLVFKPLIMKKNASFVLAAGFAGGSVSVFLSGIIMAVFLLSAQREFLEVSIAVVSIHVPVMIIEGIITMFCIGFLKKVQPGMLGRI
jgi:cobalt/nickel transport system permease protein